MSPAEWPPQCRSLSVNRVVCPDAGYVTATLPPITQAEIKASGLSWSTFGPGQCFAENAGLPATCLRASDWPPQCRSLSAVSIACPNITAALPPVTQAEVDASGVTWTSFRPDECYFPRRGRYDDCLSASDWPPQCRSLAVDHIVCADAPYTTATLPPVTQAEINASGFPWISFRLGDCYYPRTGPNQTCLSASDWPPQCRSLSAVSIACPDPRYATATLPPITQAEINASGFPWISFRPGDCYYPRTGPNQTCLSASDWPPQCRSLSAVSIACPDAPISPPPQPPALAGGKKLDCETLAKLLRSITDTTNLKDEAVQKELAALQAQQKLNGCTK